MKLAHERDGVAMVASILFSIASSCCTASAPSRTRLRSPLHAIINGAQDFPVILQRAIKGVDGLFRPGDVRAALKVGLVASDALNAIYSSRAPLSHVGIEDFVLSQHTFNISVRSCCFFTREKGE